MPEKTEAENQTRSRVSSAYTRVVGNVQFDVHNTKQTPDLPKKAYSQKWAVVRREGKRVSVVATSDKKYPAIGVLRQAEIDEKAKLAEKSSDE